MLPKTSAYKKSIHVYFLSENDDLLKKYIVLFGIKSALILKINLMVDLFTINFFGKPQKIIW